MKRGITIKKVFKIIGKIIIYLLLFTTLLTGFIVVSRKVNQSKIDKELLAYKTHPRINEMYKPSPENIGVIKKKFIEGNIRGYHHIPNDIRHKGVVITFGGSDGGMYEYMSNYLSSDGYEVVAVSYFGEKGQSEVLERVPLEIYEEIYSYIKTNCNNPETITILGASKGAELALLLSTYYDTIDNIVLFAPSSYISKANYLVEVSPWTYNGKDVDYLNGKVGVIRFIQRTIGVLLNKPDEQRIYKNVITKNSTNLEESRIKVENTNAKMLIFYGEDDRLGDAESYSNIIKEYAKNEIIIHGYENTGHVFGGATIAKIGYNYRLFGGELDSNIEADLDSKRILLETLELWHK